jgi:hypothetical protein
MGKEDFITITIQQTCFFLLQYRFLIVFTSTTFAIDVLIWCGQQKAKRPFIGIMSVSGIIESTCCLHLEASCYSREVSSRLGVL